MKRFITFAVLLGTLLYTHWLFAAGAGGMNFRGYDVTVYCTCSDGVRVETHYNYCDWTLWEYCFPSYPQSCKVTCL